MARPDMHLIVGAVLDGASIPYTVDHGGRHIKVRWEINGKAYSYSCSRSPSDRRAQQNCRCDVRRILRSAGVQA